MSDPRLSELLAALRERPDVLESMIRKIDETAGNDFVLDLRIAMVEGFLASLPDRLGLESCSLSRLTQQEQVVAKLYCGIGHDNAYTTDEIRKILKITRSRTVAVRDRILEKYGAKHTAELCRLLNGDAVKSCSLCHDDGLACPKCGSHQKQEPTK